MKANRKSDRAASWFDLFSGAGRDEGEIGLFASLFDLFSSLAEDDSLAGTYPELPSLVAACGNSLQSGRADGAETGLAAAYAYLHGADKAYSPAERTKLDALGGYWCHAGGFSPLWRAREHIFPDTCLADYGAGNGLQGLLFQHLYPHRRTTLIEISGPMIERGRELQRAMKIADERIEWIHGSVEKVAPSRFDFIYIYRPLRPEGEAGRRFYRQFAADLASSGGRVVIFSIADCLKDFLDRSCRLFYDDGQLACFRKGAGPGSPSAN